MLFSYIFCSTNPYFLGILFVILDWCQDKKGSLIGDTSFIANESDWLYRMIASLSPINEPFLSFNTNQKPCINSLKSGDLQNKQLYRAFTRLFFLPSKYKRRKRDLAMGYYQTLGTCQVVLCIMQLHSVEGHAGDNEIQFVRKGQQISICCALCTNKI